MVHSINKKVSEIPGIILLTLFIVYQMARIWSYSGISEYDQILMIIFIPIIPIVAIAGILEIIVKGREDKSLRINTVFNNASRIIIILIVLISCLFILCIKLRFLSIIPLILLIVYAFINLFLIIYYIYYMTTKLFNAK